MEVTRRNFLEVFPEIIQKLETASFVSFDAEYTGLKGEDDEVTSYVGVYKFSEKAPWTILI